MSLATWKKEFYPVPASKVSKKNALAHSLKKWEGTFSASLARHGIRLSNGILYDEEGFEFEFGDTDCALCVNHRQEVDSCQSCPLFKSLGRVCYGNESEYAEFLKGNPKPMIFALRRAVKEKA